MSAYGVGCVDRVDGVEHAVVHHRFSSDTALCGAGRITLVVEGEFDPGERYACPLCALAVVEEDGELAPAVARLVAEFPDVPPDVVVSLLSDSYRSVIGWTERPLVDKAEDLTRLRLEVRTRHPAGRGRGTGPGATPG
jgi:hypothetical protein